MGLEFLYGASGHGKTYILYNRIINEAINCDDSSRKYILIVPEQSSLQAQKDIVRMHPNKGVFNIDVLTFGRLGYRIFDELSTNLNEIIDDTGKNLIIRKVMNEVKDELKIIKANNRIGVVSEVKSMISELKQYGITPDGLAEIISNIKGSERLRQKLNDVLIIYRGFESYIRGNYSTVEDRPEELLKVIDKSGFLDNAVVAFDGFTGFTPVQYKLFEKILLKAEHVINTVTLPKNEPHNVIDGEEELFFMSKNMMGIMGRIADKNGVSVKYTAIDTDEDKYRFAKSPELDFLEKELFRYSGRTFEKDVNDIHVREMSTPQMEVKIVAADILRLVKEKELRFRDVAIVTGDISVYGDYLRRTFEESEIPFFMDNKNSLIGNPVVEYIRSAIEMVADNFSYDSVFRFLKNGLSKIDIEMVDILENYALAFGIRGFNNWNERFVRPYPGKIDILDKANRAREEFVGQIKDFYSVFSVRGSASDKIIAVYELMETAGAYEYLEEMASELTEWENTAWNMARASQYRQTYAKILGLLEQLKNLLGDEEMTSGEFSEILDAGFEEIKVGIIPPSVDCVTIGDVERTRLEHVKALFVLGVNEEILPKLSSNQGVLSENERYFLSDNEVELAPTPRQKIFIQNFYLYLNLTEPETALFMSYHRYNSAGKDMKPSRIVSMIKNMYPKLTVKSEEEFNPVDYLTNAKNAMHLAATGLFLESDSIEGVSEIVAYLMDNEPYRSRLENYALILTEENLDKVLKDAVAKELYAEIERSSISRIESYAKCAFSQFLKYGLELEERKKYELNDMDLGNIFHKVIELVTTKLKAEGKDFSMLLPEERRTLVENCVMDSTIDFNASIFISGSMNAYMKQRIIGILDRFVEFLGLQIANSKLRPYEIEKGFYKEVDGTTIVGRIDRVDMYESEDKVYVKIIDYKSSNNSLSIDDIYNGINLQLMVYLKNIVDRESHKHPDKEVVAAGVLYNKVHNPIIDKDKFIKGEMEQAMRPTGMVSFEAIDYMDEWDTGKSACIPVTKKKDGTLYSSSSAYSNEQLMLLAEYATNKMVEMNSEIKEGNINIKPYEKACEFCSFAQICEFDKKKHKYRKLESIENSEDMWTKLGFKSGEEE